MDDHMLFIVKGGVALLGLMLMLRHMIETPQHLDLPRKLRYVALLIASGSIAFASQEQVAQNVAWQPRNWGGLVTAIAVLVAAVASLVGDRRDTRIRP